MLIRLDICINFKVNETLGPHKVNEELGITHNDNIYLLYQIRSQYLCDSSYAQYQDRLFATPPLWVEVQQGVYLFGRMGRKPNNSGSTAMVGHSFFFTEITSTICFHSRQFLEAKSFDIANKYRRSNV